MLNLAGLVLPRASPPNAASASSHFGSRGPGLSLDRASNGDPVDYHIGVLHNLANSVDRLVLGELKLSLLVSGWRKQGWGGGQRTGLRNGTRIRPHGSQLSSGHSSSYIVISYTGIIPLSPPKAFTVQLADEIEAARLVGC